MKYEEPRQPSFYELYGSIDPNRSCIHEVCPNCKGTGKKKDGTPCIHFLSCPCPKCTMRF